MREQLIAELTALKAKIQEAENAVFDSYKDVQETKRRLELREDGIILDKAEGIKIDGKNAEIRAAQVREATYREREGVREEESYLEAKKITLANLKTELRINLALVELVKGVA